VATLSPVRSAHPEGQPRAHPVCSVGAIAPASLTEARPWANMLTCFNT
jgi:hypothetical protein